MTLKQATAQILQDLTAGPIGIGCTDPRAVGYSLFQEEAVFINRAVPKRQREFAAGRAAARMAMADLGAPEQAILKDPKTRAPIWPNGLTGSITHSDQICLATVCSVETARATGIDLEPDKPLDADLWPAVFTPAETNWITQQPQQTQGHLAKLIFSAKESAYKAQFPISQRLFDFHTLEIMVSDPHLCAVFQRDIAPFRKGDTIKGAYTVAQDHILTAFIL